MSTLAASLPFALGPERAPVGVSQTSDVVRMQWLQAQRHFAAPVSRATIAQRFADLAATWKEERGASSSFTEMVLSQSYQRIIGLGPKVVPSILVKLTNEPDHWFWALTAITGVNPIPDSAAGNLPAMTSAWVKWGEEHGLLD
jgi:hypothetical protein